MSTSMEQLITQRCTVGYTVEFGQAVAESFFDKRDCEICRTELNTYGPDQIDDCDDPGFSEAWEDLNLDTVMESLAQWDAKKFW